MKKQSNMNDEEVALGQFFSMFADFLRWIFTSIFNAIAFLISGALNVLVFFRKNWVVSLLGIFIGTGVGLFSIQSGGAVYKSNLIVKTNFESSKQLYTRVDFLHNLIVTKNHELLAKELQITADEAMKIKKIEIEPIRSDIENAVAYKHYLNKVDTAYYKPVFYRDYITNIDATSYEKHVVSIFHGGNIPGAEIELGLFLEISKNPYYTAREMTALEALKQEIVRVEQEFVDLDSLKYAVNYSLKNSNSKNESGVILSISDKKENPDLSWIYYKGRELQARETQLKKELIDLTKAVEIMSPLQSVGEKKSSVKQLLVFMLVGFGFSTVVLVLMQLNKIVVARIKNN